MKLQILPFLLLSFLGFSQSPAGYWDNQRITNKEIKLSAGDKLIVKSEEFPVGTTEFAYRITLLDENQKMASDLASVLKAIPDPYYIGKGAGGAISLLSTVSGNDKCTYAIFTNETLASDFIGSASTEKACLFKKNPVSKDAKVVSIKSACLGEETKNIWFTFKNENWMMGEKIVLEIIPWVDNVASRGWTKKNKETIVENILSQSRTKYLKKEDKGKANLCLLDKISEKYRFQDFVSLSKEEQMFFVEKNEEACFQTVVDSGVYNDLICFESEKIAKTGNYDEAISRIITKVISKPSANARNYNSLGNLYLQSNQLEKALQSFKTAEKLDSGNLFVQMNLAHVYMFMGEVSKSKEIHKRYMNQNVSAKQTWKNKAVNDLDAFKKTNLPQENIAKIWRLYN